MPVQRFDTASVERPPGLVTPPADLAGVTELRLHGVGGATPEQLLGDLAPQQVAGDRIAGFYRTADMSNRHVEAYSWGGLTSHSGWRVLWVLLFPFALANVAGWMCTRATHRSRWRFRLHRTAVRWASLGLTVNLLMVMALIGMDLVAYQCGGRPDCAGGQWFLGPLRWAPFADHPGRRLLLGALLPLAVLAALAVLTLRSIKRYEQVVPPVAEGQEAPPSRHSAAQPGSGLGDRRFWDGRRGALDLGVLHLAAGLAVVAMVLAHTVHTTSHASGATAAARGLWLVALAAGGAVIAGVLALSAVDACPRLLPGLLLAGSTGALGCAGWFAAAQPSLATADGHDLPGLPNAANLILVGIFGALLLVLVSAMLGGWEKGGFFVFGPFLALVLAVSVLNMVLLSVAVSVPRLLGEDLIVPRVVWISLPYLVLVPLVAVLLFGVYQLWTYWRAGWSWRQVQAWYEEHAGRPYGEPQWTVSALRGPGARRWAARVARARRLARTRREVDKLLTAMVVVGLAILVVLETRFWIAGQPAWETAWTRTLSSSLGIALPVLVLVLLRRGWRNLESRKRIGMVWDVCTFWPRSYHPLAPPSYAERAVPELQRRLWRIHDSGGRVVLAAHSQGTVIAAAALLQPEERPDLDRVELVTFGTPLRSLYGWAFPAYFNDEVLGRLAPGSGSGVELRAWRNLYYRTDYIGHAVFDPQAGMGVDAELPDPPTCWHILDQPAPVPGSHSGYWSDPAVWQAVDRLAADGARSTGAEGDEGPGGRGRDRVGDRAAEGGAQGLGHGPSLAQPVVQGEHERRGGVVVDG